MRTITEHPAIAELRTTLEDLRYLFERIYHPGLRDEECAALARVFTSRVSLYTGIFVAYQIDVAALLRIWRDSLDAMPRQDGY
jgi:hypothetical protein